MCMRGMLSFAPRSRAISVFLASMVLYELALEEIVRRLVIVGGFWPHVADASGRSARPVRLGPSDSSAIIALVIAPLIESLILAGLIELMRWLGRSNRTQVAIAVLVVCLLHSIRWWIQGVVVAPAFLIGALAFVYLRRRSFWIALAGTVLLHSAANFFPVLTVLSQRLHR